VNSWTVEDRRQKAKGKRQKAKGTGKELRFLIGKKNIPD